MPTHSDSLGYLSDLNEELDLPWFRLLFGKVVTEQVTSLDDLTFACAYSLLRGSSSLLSRSIALPQISWTSSTTTPERLEAIDSYQGFKRLSPDLAISFPKRVNLVFGTNGSGKSSICESIALLAQIETPKRPIRNAHERQTVQPKFSYRLATSPTSEHWDESIGCGQLRTKIKFFDLNTAQFNIKQTIEPQRVVEIRPFRLDLFEAIRKVVVDFKDRAGLLLASNDVALIETVNEVRLKFDAFEEYPLGGSSQLTAHLVKSEIAKAQQSTDEETLQILEEEILEIRKAMSPDGIALLKGTRGEIQRVLKVVEETKALTSDIFLESTIDLIKEIDQKKALQTGFASTLLERGEDSAELVSLLTHVEKRGGFKLDAVLSCPVCKQELSVSAMDLFKRYSEFLNNNLQNEINELEIRIATIKKSRTDTLTSIRDVLDVSSSPAIDHLGQLRFIYDGIEELLISDSLSPDDRLKLVDVIDQLKLRLDRELQLKDEIVSLADSGQNDLAEALRMKLEDAIPHQYTKTIRSELTLLNRFCELELERNRLYQMRAEYIDLPTKITLKAKLAYGELVVDSFSESLNNEYLELSEKPISAFGVELAKIGNEATVTVTPKIGKCLLESVLSEGEQRLHSLALFFAEISSCSQHVIVFDDPVSSFDYNYVERYCYRLRKLVVDHPEKQVIVFTHSWDFFTQLQLVLNKANLNSHLSVQVLEGCSLVEEHAEDITLLKDSITRILTSPAALSSDEKGRLCGQLRRLVEAVVNKHVFNGQRHQFKAKTLQVSTFQSFEKIVPLLPAESQKLRDLYSALSPAEHDDPRNHYASVDKATYQARFDLILQIEAAVTARRP